MSTVIDTIERNQLRPGLPSFDAGDRVRVHFQVIEGSRKRTQVFEGVVIKRQGSGVRETFTVRKQSFGVGVERTFPLHSPKIEKLEVAARGDVRRAKLYYLRGRVGKAARVAERRWGIDDAVLGASADEPEALDAEGSSQDEVVGEAIDHDAEIADARAAEKAANEAAKAAAAPEPAPKAEELAEETPEAEAAADADPDASETQAAGEADDTADAEQADEAESTADGKPAPSED